jgi:hypothetical protein
VEDRQTTREKRWTQTTREEVDTNNKRRGGHKQQEKRWTQTIREEVDTKFFLIVKISKRRGKMGLSQKPK